MECTYYEDKLHRTLIRTVQTGSEFVTHTCVCWLPNTSGTRGTTTNTCDDLCEW